MPDHTLSVVGLDLGNPAWNDLRAPRLSIEWTGRLRIDRPGRYTFSLEPDDGSIPEIDGRVVVDNLGVHAVRERSGEIGLSEGLHALRSLYFNEFSGGVMRMLWTPPEGARQIVPTAVLVVAENVEPD